MKPRSLLLLALLVAATMAAQAQTVLPTTSARAWNAYVASVIPNRFSTIIGNGGALLPNSGTIGTGMFFHRTYTFTLPFPLLFLNEEFREGSTIIVSTNGFVSFHNTGMGSADGTQWWWSDIDGWSFLGVQTWSPSGEYSIFAFAGNYATDVPSGDGGLYWKLDGSAPNRVLTFEWRVTNMDPWMNNGNVGNFQLRLYEATGNLETAYGETPLETGQAWSPFFVGLKKFGEILWGPPISSNDERQPGEQDRYYLFNNPAYGQGDTVAITGMRMRCWAWGSDVEISPWFANWPLPDPVGSPYGFHYAFPTDTDGNQIGYRLSPVLDDIGTEAAWITPAQTVSAYAPGTRLDLHARFINQGNHDQESVPVRADVYRNGSKVFTTDATVFNRGASQFTVEEITFATSIGSPITNVTGVYELRVYPRLDRDQDPSNDTARATFYISRDNDIMSFSVLQPQPNLPPLFQKYPVGVAVPLEIRFLNIGLRAQRDVRVSVTVTDENGTVQYADSGVLAGVWNPITFRDWSFAGWTPTTTGRFFVRASAHLSGDEQLTNDTVPKSPTGAPFDVCYEVEIAAVDAAHANNMPVRDGYYPLGRPIPVAVTFSNTGVSDATNVPVRVRITAPNGALAYDRSSSVLNIRGDAGRTVHPFPTFTPQQAGRYVVTAFSQYADDPVRSNDTTTWSFTVKPALSGTIRVGTGERYRTLREARDSLFFYGVSGPVTFELTNDSYLVQTKESTTPALDWRGRVIGLGPTAPVVIRPAAAKEMVTIALRSTSGIGMWFGQLDSSNPSGYITFDGGPRKALTFTYENTQKNRLLPAYQRSLPVYLGQGASNYTFRNCTIRPATSASGRKDGLAIPVVRYNQSFNEFQYLTDLNLTVSAGILVRNSAPFDDVVGRNRDNRDTLRNQNITVEGTNISGFGYGVLSIGAGPLFVVGSGRYEEFHNQNNRYLGNTISDVARGGIVVLFEKNSDIIGNVVRGVRNESETMPNAWGIAAIAGGNPDNNRGYSSDLKIERNLVREIVATSGSSDGILVETAENMFVTPSNVVYRFPSGGATNVRIWNNTIATVAAIDQPSTGIRCVPERAIRSDYATTGNRIENNTIYSTGGDVGIAVRRAGVAVRNNIVNIEGEGATAITIEAIDPVRSVTCDYNAYDVPNGIIGTLQRLSTQGYSLPSPSRSSSLAQWQLNGLDANSVAGDVTREFVSTAPGSEDLHIRPEYLGSIVGNRGCAVSAMSGDIDGDPRASAGVLSAFDVGSDEFTGQVRNHDIMADAVLQPVGFRARDGAFSDAEYVMSDTLVPLRTLVRNVGGQPMYGRVVTLTVEYLPERGTPVQVFRQTRTANVDVQQAVGSDFGSFMPRTLRELGLADSKYGISPNVTPIYRFTLTTGVDDFADNNTTSKNVRFFLQRSGREALVCVKNLDGWLGTDDDVLLANRLNADTLVAALSRINWERADGVGREDYDVFERDHWPLENLDFSQWSTIIWAQGPEPEGLAPQERAALKRMLASGSANLRSTLIIAGQDVARIHDVALTAANGDVADRDFVNAGLRAEYRGGTNPAEYVNRTIRGVAINTGRFEELEATGVKSDPAPMPSLLRTTSGDGVARPSHVYMQQDGASKDSAAGVASSGATRNVVFYGFDWRHAGRYDYEPDRSGAWRLLLGALDFASANRGVLPVELVAFDVYQSAERAVSVEWTTASETKTAALVVERTPVLANEPSTGESAPATIASVPPRGSAVAGATYRVVDPGVEPGATYDYRLVSVDLDGQRTVERVARITVARANPARLDLTTRPNPVLRSGEVLFAAPDGVGITLELFDRSGRHVRTVASAVGSGRVTLDARELASGSYTLRLVASDGSTVEENIVIAR